MSSPGVGLPAPSRRGGQGVHQIERVARGGQRGGAGFGAAPLVGAEDRQQSVAQEFQDFAAVPADRPDHAIEAVVQQHDQLATGSVSANAVKACRSA